MGTLLHILEDLTGIKMRENGGPRMEILDVREQY